MPVCLLGCLPDGELNTYHTDRLVVFARSDSEAMAVCMAFPSFLSFSLSFFLAVCLDRVCACRRVHARKMNSACCPECLAALNVLLSSLSALLSDRLLYAPR
jgi:hypothetical protein